MQSPQAHTDPVHAGRGFTLVELLVVVAIVSMLLAMLMPSLSRARAQSRVSVCLSNLREIGLGVQAYAAQYNDAIPRGPADPIFYFPTQGWDEWATNQVWLGTLKANQGLGTLLDVDLRQPRVLFCPADDTNDPFEELEKIEQRGDEDAYCSYLYRQRDQITRDRLDYLGTNDLGLEARALALDANSLGEGDFARTNHEAREVNILYRDGHAETFENRQHVFSLRQEDFFGFPASVERRLNEILVAADFAESGDPTQTPPLPD
jgi:prepilin-type N-terminal cleavage/methylation domain-containing protein